MKKAKRIHNTITYKIEKRILIYLAKKLPRFITPDILTIIGLIGALGTGLCYYFSKFEPVYLLIATSFLFLNWFGDSLDGTLARVRKIERIDKELKRGYHSST